MDKFKLELMVTVMMQRLMDVESIAIRRAKNVIRVMLLVLDAPVVKLQISGNA